MNRFVGVTLLQRTTEHSDRKYWTATERSETWRVRSRRDNGDSELSGTLHGCNHGTKWVGPVVLTVNVRRLLRVPVDTRVGSTALNTAPTVTTTESKTEGVHLSTLRLYSTWVIGHLWNSLSSSLDPKEKRGTVEISRHQSPSREFYGTPWLVSRHERYSYDNSERYWVRREIKWRQKSLKSELLNPPQSYIGNRVRDTRTLKTISTHWS